MRSAVFLLLGVLIPAVAGAQASHEEPSHPAARTQSPVRAVGPKVAPSPPHEESRAEPTPTRRVTRTPTAREVEPTRPVVRDVLKEDAAKLEAFKAAQAAREAKSTKAEKSEKAEKADTVEKPGKAEVAEKPAEAETHTKDEAPTAAAAMPKGRRGKPATMSGRILTKSNKQLEDVAARVNARLDAVNAEAPPPTEKNANVETIVAQINRRLEREAAARSVRRQQTRKEPVAAPRIGLSWRVPVQWSELQSKADAEIPRPTQLSWPLPSWVPTAQVAQRQQPAGRGQGPVE